jgi:hypothetical protein
MEPCRNPIRHLSNRQVVLLFPVVAAVVPPTGLDMEWIVSLITNNRARQIEQSYRQVTGDLALHFPVVPWWSVWLGYLLLAIRSHATINTTAMHIDHPVELLCYTQPCSLFFWWLSENTVGVVVENADLLSDTIGSDTIRVGDLYRFVPGGIVVDARDSRSTTRTIPHAGSPPV